LICSQCCGRNRRKLIECSDDCRFFLEGRRQALKRLVDVSGDGAFELKFFSVLHDFRLTLVKFREIYRDAISDSEIVTAIKNAAETLRVRSRGLIFDFKSTNPTVQQATDSLLEIAEWYHNKGTEGSTIGFEELSAGLRYLEKQILSASQRSIDFWSLVRGTVGMRLLVKTPEKIKKSIR
ncbi:MAG: hypothetical protein ACUVUD_07615, partial [bacterium]